MVNVNSNLISETRKEISKYISRHRLIKVTIFSEGKYHSTMILSKKSNVFGYSKYNPKDTFVDKSIGTFYAIYRYISNLKVIDQEDKNLLAKIYKAIPTGYKKFVKNSNPIDSITNTILYYKSNLVVGYNKIDFDTLITKYETIQINGMRSLLSNQDITYKFN